MFNSVVKKEWNEERLETLKSENSVCSDQTVLKAKCPVIEYIICTMVCISNIRPQDISPRISQGLLLRREVKSWCLPMLHGHHPRSPTHIRQGNCWHTCTWAPQSRPALCILSLPYQSIVTKSSWPKPNSSPTLTGWVIIHVPDYGMSSQTGQPSSSVVTVIPPQ